LKSGSNTNRNGSPIRFVVWEEVFTTEDTEDTEEIGAPSVSPGVLCGEIASINAVHEKGKVVLPSGAVKVKG
jgi:hypothetical protein